MNAPEISRISPFKPGETMQIFGENIKGSRVFLWLPKNQSEEELKLNQMFESRNDLPENPPEDVFELEVVGEYEQVLYAKIEGYDMAFCGLVWLENAYGISKATVVNKPEIWNISLESIMPGDRISFYGRNFMFSDLERFRGKKCLLQNKATKEIYSLRWGTSQDIQQFMPYQNDHKCEFLVPEEVPAGEYRLTLNNGTGGKWGWTDCIDITVKEKRSFTEFCRLKWSYEDRQGKSFDFSSVKRVAIPAQYGDGIYDVSELLQSAIDELSSIGGGLITLPSGRFGLSRTLELKSGVVIKGTGIGSTTITVAEGKSLPARFIDVPYACRKNGAGNWAVDWKPFMQKDNNTPLIWAQTNSGIEDIKLEGGSGAKMLVFIGTADGSVSKGIFFNRVEFDNKMSFALEMGGEFTASYHGIMSVCHTDDFTMFKCRVVATFPLQMLPAKCNRMRLIGNEFEVSPRQNSDNVYISGVYNAIITENVMKYGRRSLMAQQGFSNNWVFQNRSEGVSNTTNANEEYMSEYGHSSWTGNATKIDEDGILVAENLDNRILSHGGGTFKDNLKEHSWVLMIMSGRGFGQYRRVLKTVGNKIFLEKSWDVLPDEKTFFNLVTMTEHNMWICNFAGMGSGNSQFIWLAGAENIIAGHQIILGAGISLFAQDTEENENGEIVDLGVVAFNQIIGCDVRYSGTGIFFWTDYTSAGWSTLDDKAPKLRNIFGNIIRWNSVVGGSDTQFIKNQAIWLPVEKAGGIQMRGDFNIAERNIIAGFPIGVRVRICSKGNLISGNRIRETENKILLEGDENNFVINEE